MSKRKAKPFRRPRKPTGRRRSQPSRPLPGAWQIRPLTVPTEVAYARAEWVFERHAAWLMNIPGVLSVDIGLRYQAQRPTGEVAIRVHVARKLPEAQLGKRLIPRQIEGVTVDVIERQFRLARTELPAAVPPGDATVWIAPRHAPEHFGTATVAVRDLQQQGQTRILTCAHVLAGNRPVQELDVHQAEVINARGITVGVGVVGRWIVDETIDAALWTITAASPAATIALPAVRRIGRLERQDIIDRNAVWKNGAQTGMSIGQVESVRSLPIPVQMPDGSTVWAENHVQIRAADGRRFFAQRGDSGAAVLRATSAGDTEWVAVVRAVDAQGFAVACHADQVAARLEVVL